MVVVVFLLPALVPKRHCQVAHFEEKVRVDGKGDDANTGNDTR